MLGQGVRVPLLNVKGNIRFYEVEQSVVDSIAKKLRGNTLNSKFYVSTNRNLDEEALANRVLYADLRDALQHSYRSTTSDTFGRDYFVYVVGFVGGNLQTLKLKNLNDLGFLDGAKEEKETDLVVTVGDDVITDDELEGLDTVDDTKVSSLSNDVLEEVTEGRPNGGFIDTISYRKNGAFSFDLEEPELELENEVLKKEYDKFLKLQKILKDTSSVPKEERKHLSYVTSVGDVFVDKEDYSEPVVLGVTNMLTQGLLPYQYRKGGDMVLNPNGAVLVASLSKLGVSGVEDYTDRYVSVMSGVLFSLMLRGKEVHEYNWGSVAMVALTRGLDNNLLYPFVKKDNYDITDFTKVCSVRNEDLYREFRNTLVGKPVRGIEVLGLVISTIIDSNLFEVDKLGFPSLRDMITRYELATLLESGDIVG